MNYHNNKEWNNSIDISQEFLERVKENQGYIKWLFLSIPKFLEDFDFKIITETQIKHLEEISEIWEFHIWELNGKIYFTIKWVHDITEWFIWYTPELVSYGDTILDAIDNFYNSLNDCPDWVLYSKKWFTDFKRDEEKQKYIAYKCCYRSK